MSNQPQTHNENFCHINIFLENLYTELRIAKEELSSIKNQIRSEKNEYKTQLNFYITFNNDLIKRESNLEFLFYSLAKIKKQILYKSSQITDSIVNRFSDKTNIPCVPLEKLLLLFFGFSSSMSFSLFVKINRNFDEWSNSFRVAMKRKYTLEELKQMKEYIEILSTNNSVNFPFDKFYEIIKLKVQEHELNKELHSIMNELEIMRNKKDKIFLHVKYLKTKIGKFHSKTQIISKYLKEGIDIIDKINKCKLNNNENDINEIQQIIAHFQFDNKDMKDVFNTIEIDNITSLTLRSEYSDDLSLYSFLTIDKQINSVKHNIMKNNQRVGDLNLNGKVFTHQGDNDDKCCVGSSTNTFDNVHEDAVSNVINIQTKNNFTHIHNASSVKNGYRFTTPIIDSNHKIEDDCTRSHVSTVIRKLKLINEASNKDDINEIDMEQIENEFDEKFNEEITYTVSSNINENNEKTIRSPLTQLIIKKSKFDEMLQNRRRSSNKKDVMFDLAVSQNSNCCVSCT